jgi:hypothetical protein
MRASHACKLRNSDNEEDEDTPTVKGKLNATTEQDTFNVSYNTPNSNTKDSNGKTKTKELPAPKNSASPSKVCARTLRARTHAHSMDHIAVQTPLKRRASTGSFANGNTNNTRNSWSPNRSTKSQEGITGELLFHEVVKL